MALRTLVTKLQNFRQATTLTTERYYAKSGKGYKIRKMKRADIQDVYELLEKNDLNVEKSYLECLFDTDPTGLAVVANEDGQIIGHHGIFIQTPSLATPSITVLKEEYRGIGIGQEMVRHFLDMAGTRNVGGIVISHRMTFFQKFCKIKSYSVHYNQGPVNLEFIRDVPRGDFEIVNAKEINFNEVIAYDSELNTVPRQAFLRNWAKHESAKTYVALKSGYVMGYGVLRPADAGCRMYPLYANDPRIARALFCKLASFIPTGRNLIFTQPQENAVANEFVAANNLNTVCLMTRLNTKWNVRVDIKRVYSIGPPEYGFI